MKEIDIPRLARPGYRRPRISMTQGKAAVLDPDGSVIWEDLWQDNALMDEGEASMLNVYLLTAANPQKWLALINGGTTPPTETSTLTYMAGAAGAGETKGPGASGYNRQEVTAANWSAPALDSGDMQSAAAEKTFGPASGSAWTVTHVGMVTHATAQSNVSGLFLLFLALSGSTTINIDQSFKYTLRFKMS
jgi:hypothetical protein